MVVLTDGVELTTSQQAELWDLVGSSDVSASVGMRARVVLWHAEGRLKKDVAVLAGVSRPTVDSWLSRYAAGGIAGLLDQRRGAGREQVSSSIRARILAVTRMSPPQETGLSHWSSREMAAFIARTEGVTVSHNYVARLWRDNGLTPHRQGTFEISKDPEFADKVADIVGLYLDPRAGLLCCLSTRKHRSRRWIGPSRCCRSRSTRPRNALTTMCGTG